MSDPSTARNTRTCDFVVVGGGLLGIASAAALARDGLDVVLVDRAPGPASASSGAAAGIVSLLYPWEYPDALQRLAAYSARIYPGWCARIAAATGLETGWAAPGVISFDVDGAPPDITRLDAAGVRARSRAVSPPADEALWLPDVACVEPKRLAEAAAADARARGVRFRWEHAVEAIVVERGAVAGVRAGGRTVHARNVLVAAGAWSRALLAPLGVELAVEPVRGQIVEFAGPPGLLDTIVVYGHRYVLPRADGRILVGSTSEPVGFDAAVTDQAARDLREAAAALVPATSELPVRAHWAGLRPGSPDGMPSIGPVPGIRGLWLNAGHFRNGVTLTPGSAEVLAALVAGRAPPVPADGFLPR